MASARRKVAIPLIAIASALALSFMTALPASAVATGWQNQICGGPYDAQVHFKTGAHTGFTARNYSNQAAYKYFYYPTGGDRYMSGYYQSYTWNVTADSIAIAAGTCIL